jgi:hypothetical protein
MASLHRGLRGVIARLRGQVEKPAFRADCDRDLLIEVENIREGQDDRLYNTAKAVITPYISLKTEERAEEIDVAGRS